PPRSRASPVARRGLVARRGPAWGAPAPLVRSRGARATPADRTRLTPRRAERGCNAHVLPDRPSSTHPPRAVRADRWRDAGGSAVQGGAPRVLVPAGRTWV